MPNILRLVGKTIRGYRTTSPTEIAIYHVNSWVNHCNLYLKLIEEINCLIHNWYHAPIVSKDHTPEFKFSPNGFSYQTDLYKVIFTEVT